MQSHRRLVHSCVAAALAATIVNTPPGVAFAEDKKPALLSRDWFLSKADEIPDKLLDVGKDLLTDAAKDLFKAALSAELPGLGAIIFGGDGPSEDTKLILDAINQARDAVINAVVCNVSNQSLKAEWPDIRKAYSQFYEEPIFANQVGDFDSGAYDTLNTTMNNLQSELQNFDNVFGIDSVHTLVTLVQLHLQQSKQYARLIAFKGFEDINGNVPFDELTPEELATIDQNTNEKYQKLIYPYLVGKDGVLTYFEGLSRNDMFRKYSDAAFSPLGHHDIDATHKQCDNLQCQHPGYFFPYATYTITHGTAGCTQIKDKDNVVWQGEYNLDTDSFPITISDPLFKVDLTPCTTFHGPVPRAFVQMSVAVPNGPTFTELAVSSCTSSNGDFVPDDLEAAGTRLMNRHKDWFYRQNLLASYGTIRPIIDRWYAAIGQSRPGSVYPSDIDLDDIAVGDSTFFFGPADQLTTHPVDPTNYPWRTVWSSTRDQGASVTAFDTRGAANYALVHGRPTLAAMAWSEYTNDSINAEAGGPLLSEYMRVIAADRTDYGNVFRSSFAAKVLTTLR